jgi:hypothetical protein
MKTIVLSCLLLFSSSSWALIPIEGLLKGEVDYKIQYDPLMSVFRPSEESSDSNRALHKSYIIHAKDSVALKQSCDFIGKSGYMSLADESRARRSVVATLQYLGLDLSVKAIAQLSRGLQWERDDYAKMINTLVGTSCTPNLSVYGIKFIRQNLLNYFDNPPEQSVLGIFPSGSLNSQLLAQKAQSLEVRERELHHSLMLFRSLCSWGGDTQDYRLLPPLLKTPMS